MKHEYLNPNRTRVRIIGALATIGFILISIGMLGDVEYPPILDRVMGLYMGLLIAWYLTQFGWHEHKEARQQAEVERVYSNLRKDADDDMQTERLPRTILTAHDEAVIHERMRNLLKQVDES